MTDVQDGFMRDYREKEAELSRQQGDTVYFSSVIAKYRNKGFSENERILLFLCTLEFLQFNIATMND